MKQTIQHYYRIISIVTSVALSLTGCDLFAQKAPDQPKESINEQANMEQPEEQTTDQQNEQTEQQTADPDENKSEVEKPDLQKPVGDSIQVVANPEDTAVLVNKHFKLPDDYEPTDLVYPDVRFIFSEKVEKRMMREEAAEALKNMFTAAEKDGIMLAGASGYRSHTTQINLYNHYVQKDGVEAADRYSARPGHSEHQTGLTMDVSGSSGKCAIQDCFKDEPEADWVAKNAHEFGFIVRYPEGKEDITGYKYEPWHIRYVGVAMAKEIYEQDVTLEEYFGVAVPVGGE